MKRSVKWMVLVLSVALVFAVGMLLTPPETLAQKAGALAKKIQGTWVLVSVINELDGKRIEVFGPNPRGSMVLTPNGRFSIIYMRSSLPKFGANNRLKGTAEENQAIVQGSLAYFGRYTVDEKEKTINQATEGSTFPNWDGVEKRFAFSLSGDELRITSQASTIGGTNYLVWKRAK